QVAPGVAARLAWPGNRRCPPDLPAGLGIVSGDEANVVLVAGAPGDAGDGPPFRDDRTARIRVSDLAIGDLMLPYDLAGSRVERQQPCVGDGDVDLVSVNGQRAHRRRRSEEHTSEL